MPLSSMDGAHRWLYCGAIELIYTRTLFLRAGRDSTEDFEEIGHSSTAQEMLQTYYIGDFAVGF